METKFTDRIEAAIRNARQSMETSRARRNDSEPEADLAADAAAVGRDGGRDVGTTEEPSAVVRLSRSEDQSSSQPRPQRPPRDRCSDPQR